MCIIWTVAVGMIIIDTLWQKQWLVLVAGQLNDTSVLERAYLSYE